MAKIKKREDKRVKLFYTGMLILIVISLTYAMNADKYFLCKYFRGKAYTLGSLDPLFRDNVKCEDICPAEISEYSVYQDKEDPCFDRGKNWRCLCIGDYSMTKAVYECRSTADGRECGKIELVKDKSYT